MFLSPMGYEEIEDKAVLEKKIVKDVIDNEIEEIIEELKKDNELKTLIYNYLKNYWGAKQASEMLKGKAEGLVKDLK